MFNFGLYEPLFFYACILLICIVRKGVSVFQDMSIISFIILVRSNFIHHYVRNVIILADTFCNYNSNKPSLTEKIKYMII
jgi:hypothetical protein